LNTAPRGGIGPETDGKAHEAMHRLFLVISGARIPAVKTFPATVNNKRERSDFS
jgi:hypothetical protein